MNENINFYEFMHKQILVVIILIFGTAPGYLLMGYLYSSMIVESVWYILVALISFYGYTLHKNYDKNMSILDKDDWLNRVRFFMFIYFSLWTIMFVEYTLSDKIEMHYMTIATQLGCAVVASTVLASQKTLVISTVVTLMLPITIYLILVGEVYSYLIALFTIVLGSVLLYAAKNTHNYLLKSRYQAYHDYLTKLGNRRYFLEILDSFLHTQDRGYVYLLLIDLDHFKTINDTLGHGIGDKLLQEVATRMQLLCEEYDDKVARLGGDEFCILSGEYYEKDECLEDAKLFSQKLLRLLKHSYVIDGNNLYISASIGISIVHTNYIDSSRYLKEADMAMYEAKHAGRDGIIVFNEELSLVVAKKLNIERLLRFAIERHEITLNYQPQVDSDKKVVGCEVLVRWNNKEMGQVGPDIFIPIAESTGYIIEIGEYILEESFKSIQEWNHKDFGLQQISINISMRQLMHQDFVLLVKRLFENYIGEESKINIIFEITETSTSEDISSLVKIINTLKTYNISFSMDDFGTGYSSLSYLRDIPIKELKIDQSFVRGLRDKQQASLIKTIMSISKNFDLVTVAEGVEYEYQREFLKELNCDLYQGYLFSKPLKKKQFEEFYHTHI